MQERELNMQENAELKPQQQKSLWISDIRVWQVLTVALAVILIVFLLMKKQLIITWHWLGIFAIGGAVFLIYEWMNKQKEKLNIYETAEKISDDHYANTGEILNPRAIHGLPLSDDTLMIEFIENSKVIQHSHLNGVQAITTDTLFGAKKEMENSTIARKLIDVQASREQIRTKLEELGIQF